MIPDPSTDFSVYAQALLDAVQGSHWRFAAALALIGVVACVRWLTPKLHNKVGAWLNSDRGAAVLTLVTAEVGAVATSLAAKMPLTFTLVWHGLGVGFVAAGGFATAKRILAGLKLPWV
jgi:hypothetical protein